MLHEVVDMDKVCNQEQIFRIYDISVAAEISFKTLYIAIVRNSVMLLDNLGYPRSIFPPNYFALPQQDNDSNLIDIALDVIEKQP